jgi:hypothetical protein
MPRQQPTFTTHVVQQFQIGENHLQQQTYETHPHNAEHASQMALQNMYFKALQIPAQHAPHDQSGQTQQQYSRQSPVVEQAAHL